MLVCGSITAHSAFLYWVISTRALLGQRFFNAFRLLRFSCMVWVKQRNLKLEVLMFKEKQKAIKIKCILWYVWKQWSMRQQTVDPSDRTTSRTNLGKGTVISFAALNFLRTVIECPPSFLNGKHEQTLLFFRARSPNKLSLKKCFV